jgi:hypothetical protein
MSKVPLAQRNGGRGQTVLTIHASPDGDDAGHGGIDNSESQAQGYIRELLMRPSSGNAASLRLKLPQFALELEVPLYDSARIDDSGAVTMGECSTNSCPPGDPT